MKKSSKTSDELLKNIDLLHKKYGSKLDSEMKYIIAYWQQCDGIKMKDGSFKVSDVLEKAAHPSHIVDALVLYKIKGGR